MPGRDATGTSSTGGAQTRTYGQMCPVARALDIVGERWTMLVIRELLLGPKRFKHLLAALGGIGTNRLSARLKNLEKADVVRKVSLPEPAAVIAYELTDDGERLRSPVIELGLWGLHLPLDDRLDPQTIRADLIALCLTGTHTCALDPARSGAVEFHVGDEAFHLRIQDGRFVPRSGPSPVPPTASVACDLHTFLSLALRDVTAAQAVEDGRVEIVSGPPEALIEVFDVLVYARPGRVVLPPT